MNILISSSSIDATTDMVIDWIYSINQSAKITRINDDNNYSVYFEKGRICLLLEDRKIYIDEFDSFWYRRGRIRYKFSEQTELGELKEEESKVLEELIQFKLRTKRSINDFFNSELNKLVVLEIAKEVGLEIPNSYMIQSKTDLLSLMDKKLITKSYLASATFTLGDGTSTIYTNDVLLEDANEEHFAPSFFQERVEKKIEIRVFYFRGKIWSMAIFSQNDSETATDFRTSNGSKKNKNVPFNLPEEVKLKLKKLMELLSLDCGSIDLILTPENDYVFLEVNPAGQFGMVSIPCNYFIEKEIAKYLCYES